MINICRIIDKTGISTAHSMLIGEYGCLRLICDFPSDSPAAAAAVLKNTLIVKASESRLACALEHGSVIIPKNAVAAAAAASI